MPRGIDPAIRRLRDERRMSSIAAGLKIARQAPYAWKRVPPLRVQDVSKITGLKPHELRPDLYPRPRKPTKRMSRELSSTT